MSPTDDRCLVCGTGLVNGECSPDCIMSEDAPNVYSDLNAPIVLNAEAWRVLTDLIEHPPEPTVAMRELFRRHKRSNIARVQDLVDDLRDVEYKSPRRDASGICIIVRKDGKVLYTIPKMRVEFDGVDEINIVVNVEDNEE
jgi:hypothetical protein